MLTRTHMPRDSGSMQTPAPHAASLLLFLASRKGSHSWVCLVFPALSPCYTPLTLGLLCPLYNVQDVGILGAPSSLASWA